MKKLIKYLLDFADLKRYEKRLKERIDYDKYRIQHLESVIIDLYDNGESLKMAKEVALEIKERRDREKELYSSMFK